MARSVLVVVAALCLSQCVALPSPSSLLPANSEPKPTATGGQSLSLFADEGKEYGLVSAPMGKEAPVTPPSPQAPQAQSLIQQDTVTYDAASIPPAKDPAPYKVDAPNPPPYIPAIEAVKDSTSLTARDGPATILVEPLPLNNSLTTPNKVADSYPVVDSGAVASQTVDNITETLAGPTVKDPKEKALEGIEGKKEDISRIHFPHPMEILTPLVDNFPCDADHVIPIRIPSLETRHGPLPFLPERYGCSSFSDNSREKVSPEILWDNLSADTKSFSLSLVDMGELCDGRGTDAGRIHWQVTNIKQQGPTLRLQEGASHDTRLLFGGTEEPNQWLEEYYSGPCPDKGTTGCYRLKVLAHRENGRCMCGHLDFRFNREAAPPKKEEAWVYNPSKEVLPDASAVSGVAPAPNPTKQ